MHHYFRQKMRTFISIVLGIIAISAAVFFAMGLINSKQRPEPKVEKAVASVYVDTVKNSTVPIIVPAYGNLTAVRKVELYAEVQGVLQESNKVFKPGQTYRKGNTLLKLDSEEYYASLVAQKSGLQNLITASMSDLKFDYQKAYPQWERYLRSFDLNKPVPPLPQPLSQQESFFITGRNIVTTYYNIKNMEERLRKYTIRASFDGILTEALVTPGTLVRSGQKLGEYIDPSAYELEVSISKSNSDLLRIGKKVALNNLDKTSSWTGEVVRVNGKIDLRTQTVQVFIQVVGAELKEGMYLEASLLAIEEPTAIEISRKLLVNNNQVFVVQDDKLSLVEVKLVYINDKNMVIKGLQDGTTILQRPVMGAYEGMAVKIIQD